MYFSSFWNDEISKILFFKKKKYIVNTFKSHYKTPYMKDNNKLFNLTLNMQFYNCIFEISQNFQDFKNAFSHMEMPQLNWNSKSVW